MKELVYLRLEFDSQADYIILGVVFYIYITRSIQINLAHWATCYSGSFHNVSISSVRTVKFGVL